MISGDSPPVTIRPERTGDHAAVRLVNELAFGRPEEAMLVEALRRAARPGISLVAVAGHIFLSPVRMNPAGDGIIAMGLAPMAVHPDHQRRGIGSMLVREGLRACRAIGANVVVVLGHPGFYPRFGFIPAAARGLRSRYDVPDEAFMVVELEPGILDGREHMVEYMPEFAEI